MILSSLVHTDFQPYLLPNTDAWALPGDKALELLVYQNRDITRPADGMNHLTESFRLF